MPIAHSITKHTELNWLTRHYKTYPVPELIICNEQVNGEDVGGFYVPVLKGAEYMIGGMSIDRSNGIICINPNHVDDSGSSIAHEYRHHLQHLNGFNTTSQFAVWSTDNDSSYKELIIQYFINSAKEMDALLYELNHSVRSNYTNEWFEWIVDYLDGNVNHPKIMELMRLTFG